jgi:hypothetical protein
MTRLFARVRRIASALLAAALLGLVGLMITVDLMVRAILGKEEL